MNFPDAEDVPMCRPRPQDRNLGFEAITLELKFRAPRALTCISQPGEAL
jgi:hypothetical protein